MALIPNLNPITVPPVPEKVYGHWWVSNFQITRSGPTDIGTVMYVMNPMSAATGEVLKDHPGVTRVFNQDQLRQEFPDIHPIEIDLITAIVNIEAALIISPEGEVSFRKAAPTEQ